MECWQKRYYGIICITGINLAWKEHSEKYLKTPLWSFPTDIFSRTWSFGNRFREIMLSADWLHLTVSKFANIFSLNSLIINIDCLELIATHLSSVRNSSYLTLCEIIKLYEKNRPKCGNVCGSNFRKLP